jgi:hypothetical protein
MARLVEDEVQTGEAAVAPAPAEAMPGWARELIDAIRGATAVPAPTVAPVPPVEAE